MSRLEVRRVEHAMRRLNIFTGIPFGDFRTAFEKAVPVFDPAPYADIIREELDGANTTRTWASEAGMSF